MYSDADKVIGTDTGGNLVRMRKLLLMILLLFVLALPVSASEIVAPPVPDDVESLLPDEQDNLGESLLYILKEAFQKMQPQVADTAKIISKIFGLSMILSVLRSFSGKSKELVELTGVLLIATLLMSNSNSLIRNGTETIWKISEYGKLLCPILSATLAAQGGSLTAASIYGATALFDTVICSLISSALVPMIYIYLVIAVVNAASGDDMLLRLGNSMKGLMTWTLKILLYVFVGYISISGIISGTADQTAVKATKLTLSGMIPVVGGILSDASETILVSAGLIKNALGVYGFLSIVAITITPFLLIGINYLGLKLITAFAGIFVSKTISKLLDDFTGALGMVLGMTGSVCLIQLISIVCFLKGMG
jgi:stage III sporulation protein AE